MSFNAFVSFGIMRSIRRSHRGPTVSLHGFSLPIHACTHVSSTWANDGSSFAPAATTIATTRLRVAIRASCLDCEISPYCSTFPRPTCADGAPEQARLYAFDTSGSFTWKIDAWGERWHQSPFSPLVPRS